MAFSLKPTSDYKSLSLQESYAFLQATEHGLSGAALEERLSFFGRNEIMEKKKNPLLEFVARYWGPMPWLLELAMVLAFLLKHDLEGSIIFVLLTVNAIIGFFHSRGSQKAVELLKQRLAIKAKVLRDGQWQTQGADRLVPGDVITVGLGDIIPADGKIISGDISVNESALTGESLPVEKHANDLVYSGSVARRGQVQCLVVNTGANTYFGKTTELVKIAKPKSHQEEIMMAIVRYMMYLGIAASLVVAIFAFTMQISVLLIMSFITEFLMGAIPVALPAVMTIVQAVTATKLALKGVLVARLDSIEDAASISVLCLDKTGTITQNKLAVRDSIPFSGSSSDDVIRTAVLASRAEGMDLIDVAIIEYAQGLGIRFDADKQVSYTPFNPSIKRTEAIVESDGKRYRVVKGAAQVILSLCTDPGAGTPAQVDEHVGALSQKGYRTIAVAKSVDDTQDNLKLVGLIALADPPRPDSKTMIEEIRGLDVKPLMLTGDSLAIAQEIAGQVGLGTNIIKLSDIAHLTEDEQAKAIASSDGFAEIYPEDKYKIVKLLQSRGHMVGMTGDGVNDAPALKQAEMGIAVSDAADVAKASASVVLTRPGVSVIVDAVRSSRETYQRMLTWVINKVTKVIQLVGLLTIGFFMTGEMVLSLLGMSLLVFANDFVTMSLATDNVAHTIAPSTWKVRSITLASLVVGALLIIEGVLAVIGGMELFHLDLPHLQTFVLLMLVFTSQFRVLIVRERRLFWSSVPGRALLVSSTSAIIVFFLLGVYGVIVPALPVREVVAVLGFSGLFTLLTDVPKYYAFKRFGVE